VVANQTDSRLDALFKRLHQIETPKAASRIASQIWVIWIASNDNVSNELMRRGIAAIRLGRYNFALNQFNLLVRHEPDYAESWIKRATALYALGSYQSPIEDIRRVLALEPRHFGTLAGLGMCYEAVEDREAAIKTYELALDANPHLSRVRRRLEELRENNKIENI